MTFLICWGATVVLVSVRLPEHRSPLQAGCLPWTGSAAPRSPAAASAVTTSGINRRNENFGRRSGTWEPLCLCGPSVEGVITGTRQNFHADFPMTNEIISAARAKSNAALSKCHVVQFALMMLPFLCIIISEFDCNRGLGVGGELAHPPSSPCSALIIRGKLRLSLAQQDARCVCLSPICLRLAGVTADRTDTQESTSSSTTQQSLWWLTGQRHPSTTTTTFALQRHTLRPFIVCDMKDHRWAAEMEKNQWPDSFSDLKF